MHRRKAIKLLASTALAAALAPGARAARPSDRIVVIGAGILGASIGFNLAKRGAKVTILEKTAPASATTGDSFAYLNASTKTSSRPYFELNWRGIEGWQRWQQEFKGQLPLRLNGAVYWRDTPPATQRLLKVLRHCQEWGYPAIPLDAAELQALLPYAKVGPVGGAVLYEQEGIVDPVGAVDVLLERAQAAGATVKFPVHVTGFDTASDRVLGVRTSEGSLPADAVVVAAGLGSQGLTDALGFRLPLVTSKGLLVHTAPQPQLLDRVLFAPGSTIKQNPDGRIVSSNGHEGSAASKDTTLQGRQVLEDAARYLPQVRDATIERVTLGERVLPEDGFPIVGAVPSFRNVYVAVTHSGITLAPVIGQYAAREILDRVDVDALRPFRPSRFS